MTIKNKLYLTLQRHEIDIPFIRKWKEKLDKAFSVKKKKIVRNWKKMLKASANT